MVDESLLKEREVIADRSDSDGVVGELNEETAVDESDVGSVVGEVDIARGAIEADSEPSADALSRNAMADGSDILIVLGLERNSRLEERRIWWFGGVEVVTQDVDVADCRRKQLILIVLKGNMKEKEKKKQN